MSTPEYREFEIDVDGGKQVVEVPSANLEKWMRRMEARGVGFRSVGAPDQSMPDEASESTETTTGLPSFVTYQAPHSEPPTAELATVPKERVLPVDKIEGDPTPYPTMSEREAYERNMADAASASHAGEMHGYGSAYRDLQERIGTTKLTDPLLRLAGVDIPQNPQTYERRATRGFPSSGAPAAPMAPLQQLAASKRDAEHGWNMEDDAAWREQPGWSMLGQVAGIGGTAAVPLGPAAKGAQVAERAGAPLTKEAIKLAKREALKQRVKAASVGGGVAGGTSMHGSSRAETPWGVALDTLFGIGTGMVAGPVVSETARGVYQGAKALPGLAWGGVKRGGQALMDLGAYVHGRTMPEELAAAGRQVVADTPAGRQFRTDMLAGESGTRTTEMANELTGLSRATDAVTDYANVSMKPEVVESGIVDDYDALVKLHGSSGALQHAQQQTAHDALQSTREIADFLRTYHNGAGPSRHLDRVIKEVEPMFPAAKPLKPADPNELQTVESINTAIAPKAPLRKGQRGRFEKSPETPVQVDVVDYPQDIPLADVPRNATNAFIGMDKLKRGIGELFKSQDQTVRQVAKEAYERIRSALEDQSIWGPRIAGMQRESNAAYTAAINADRAGFERKFMSPSPTDRTANNLEPLPVGNTRSVGGFLKSLGTPEAQSDVDLMRAGVKTQANLADTLARTYQVPDPIQQLAQRGKSYAGGIEQQLGDATREASAARAMEQLAQAKGDQGWLGKVLNPLPHPATSGRFKATVERDRARQLAQKEAEGAAQRLAGEVPQPQPRRLPRSGALSTTAGRTAAPMAPQMSPAMAQPASLDEQSVRAALQQNPQAYGEYSQQIIEADQSEDPHQLRATLHELAQDPNFRRQYLPQQTQ